MSELKDWVDRRQCYPGGEDFLIGQDLLDLAREWRGNNVLLSFSRGKDSVATWLYLRENGFEILPYTLYVVPGLGYQERALKYYEDFFGQHIMRLPHPHFYYLLNNGVWMPPTDWATIKAFDLPSSDTLSFATVDNLVANDAGWTDPMPWCAMGMRRADNLMRMTLIDQCGVMGSRARRFFYPIWDWKIDDVCEIIDRYDAAIAVDYELFGWRGTTETMSYRRLKRVRDHYPEDWEKMLEWFPLLDSQMFRYEVVGQ
jgi:hypothetical protein